ncbi:MAG: hypothetical protein QXV22_02730 [Thermoplasmataceae archaeon]
MVISGMMAAKIAALVTATGIGVAAAHGNLSGISVALSHVPAWTHAHSVLSHLAANR